MKEKRKVLERRSTASGKNCPATARPHLYSDYIILIKRQTTQCLFHKTTTEDWPLQDCEEPFHSLVRKQADNAGNRKLLFASVIPVEWLLTDCLTARRKHTVLPRRIPYPEGLESDVMNAKSRSEALESLHVAVVAQCRLRLQKSQAVKDCAFNSKGVLSLSSRSETGFS